MTLLLNRGLRGLRVLSQKGACTSRFDYHAELLQYGIEDEDWERFTTFILHEMRLSHPNFISMIGDGPNTLAVGGVVFGVSSAIPIFFVARASRVKEQLLGLLASLTNCRVEVLSHHLAHWNDNYFRPRGVIVRLDLFDGEWYYQEDMSKPELLSKGQNIGQKVALHKIARIVVMPLKVRVACSVES